MHWSAALRTHWQSVSDRYCLGWHGLTRAERKAEARDECVRQRLLDGLDQGEIAQWLLDVGLHPLVGETKTGRTPKRQLESARITVAQIKRKLRERGDLPEHMRGDRDWREPEEEP